MHVLKVKRMQSTQTSHVHGDDQLNFFINNTPAVVTTLNPKTSESKLIFCFFMETAYMGINFFF